MNANGQVGKTMMAQLDTVIVKLHQLAAILKSIKSNLHLALDPSTLITQLFLMTLCILIPGEKIIVIKVHAGEKFTVRTQINLNQHVQTLILPIPGVLCAAMITE